MNIDKKRAKEALNSFFNKTISKKNSEKIEEGLKRNGGKRIR